MSALLDFARSHLSPEGIQFFSDRALWAAGESQKATAIPALVLVGSASLLVLLAWIWLVGLLWRVVRA